MAMQAPNENLSFSSECESHALKQLNSCFQHCRLHRCQRGEKKTVVLVRADPGASAISQPARHTAPTKRHAWAGGQPVPLLRGAGSQHRARRSTRPTRPWSRGYTALDTVYVHGKFSKTRAYVRDARRDDALHAPPSHVGLGRRGGMTDRRREQRRRRRRLRCAGTLTDWHLLLLAVLASLMAEPERAQLAGNPRPAPGASSPPGTVKRRHRASMWPPPLG